VLALAVGVHAAGFALLAILTDRAFNTGRFDLGNMVQAVSSTADGDFLQVTDVRGHQISRLASHFDPILAAFAPLWWVWPSADMLFTVQALAIALGAVPVYRLARKHLGSELAGLAFAAAYLLYPATGWLALNEFHPVSLACPLLLYAFWYLDEDRLVPFALFSLVAVATKEDVGLIVAGYGVWYALARRHRLAGFAIATAGAAASAVALYLVVPHFNGAPSNFYGRYSDVGGSPGQVLLSVFTHPLRIAEALFTFHHVLYLGDLVLPLLALPLLSSVALVALPELALNLLSATSLQSSVRFHYTATEIPPLIAASVFGAARILEWRPERLRRLPVYVTAVALVASYQLGPALFWRFLPGAGGNVASAAGATRHDEIAAAALELVPPRAAVSATNSLGAHLSTRRRIYSFPVVRDARLIVVDEKRLSFQDRVEPIAAALKLAQLRRDPRWRIAFERDGVVILERQGR
jgi:uncharacterized membrane protein